jgi:hypothetical protein
MFGTIEVGALTQGQGFGTQHPGREFDMALNVPNMDIIGQQNPAVYEALQTIIAGVNNMAAQTNAEPGASQNAAPPTIAGFNVVESGGIHDLQITDNAPAYRGVNYFAEYSQTPDFSNAHQIDLGSSQNHRANLGSGVYYWRASSSYGTSNASPFVYHGGAQALAVGSGSYAGPPMQPRQGAQGYGSPYRNSAAPPVRR